MANQKGTGVGASPKRYSSRSKSVTKPEISRVKYQKIEVNPRRKAIEYSTALKDRRFSSKQHHKQQKSDVVERIRCESEVPYKAKLIQNENTYQSRKSRKQRHHEKMVEPTPMALELEIEKDIIDRQKRREVRSHRLEKDSYCEIHQDQKISLPAADLGAVNLKVYKTSNAPFNEEYEFEEDDTSSGLFDSANGNSSCSKTKLKKYLLIEQDLLKSKSFLHLLLGMPIIEKNEASVQVGYHTQPTVVEINKLNILEERKQNQGKETGSKRAAKSSQVQTESGTQPDKRKKRKSKVPIVPKQSTKKIVNSDQKLAIGTQPEQDQEGNSSTQSSSQRKKLKAQVFNIQRGNDRLMPLQFQTQQKETHKSSQQNNSFVVSKKRNRPVGDDSTDNTIKVISSEGKDSNNSKNEQMFHEKGSKLSSNNTLFKENLQLELTKKSLKIINKSMQSSQDDVQILHNFDPLTDGFSNFQPPKKRARVTQ